MDLQKNAITTILGGAYNYMKMQWSLIAGLLFALLTAVFAVINVNPVEVNFYFSVISLPLILLIIGCTLIGGIIVGSYGIYRQYKLQREIKRLGSELNHVIQATGYSPSPNNISDTLEDPKEDASLVNSTK
jgi:putative membrane protein